MDDLTVKFIKIRDTFSYDDGGATVREREYVFKIGSTGPYTERVGLATFDPMEIDRRVQLLKAHLAGLPR